jgi:signal transduction histidine kinase
VDTSTNDTAPSLVRSANFSCGLWPHKFGAIALYLLAYLFTDWLNSIYPHDLLGIPPWNPRPAIELVALLLCGFSKIPLLSIGALATAILPKTGATHVLPDSLVAITELAVYAGAAWMLKRRLRVDPDLGGFDDVFRFIGTIAAAAALMSVLYVTTYWSADLTTTKQLPADFFQYWVGDMIGGMVMGPFLLVNRRTPYHLERLKSLLSWECLALAALIGWILFIIFPRTVGSRFYPMFIPLVWVAARYGLTGVASILLFIQAAFITCITGLDLPSNQIVKLQILMLTLATTGLLLGAVITERERARRSVTQGEARLKAIIDMAPDGMVLIDDTGCIEMTNRQFDALAAAPEASILGRSLDAIIRQPSSGAEDRAVHRTDGTRIPVETSLATIEIGGRRTQVVAVRDISARRRAAARLGQRRAELESASRNNLTEELAAALAHELNQPLSAVITYTGACQRTLAGTDVPPRALEQLAKAAAQAERAGQVLRRLREFFRNSTIETQPTAIADMVKEVLMLLADEAARIGVHFDLAIDEGLVAHVDRLQIEQVLINLVRNSIDALDAPDHDDRQITIVAKQTEDKMIEIAVTDSGPGIASEVTGDLFHPFTTTRQTGMGLGLSISRSLVQANGGQLWAEERRPPGATFRFTVPPQDPRADTCPV